MKVRTALVAGLVILLLDGATPSAVNAALSATCGDAAGLKTKELKHADAALGRELRRVPDKEANEDDDDDDDDAA